LLEVGTLLVDQPVGVHICSAFMVRAGMTTTRKEALPDHYKET
jgi:hypothetical protein